MQFEPRKISQATYRALFWIILACITAFRLLLIDKFGLGVDESHYLMYSRHLAWGYFDHPPMVGFLAWLTTLPGDSVFFVRLGPVLCSAAGFILLRHLALALYQDEGVAFWAMVLINLMPYQQLLLVALLPDAPLNVFWCATLLAVWHAVQSGKWSWWVLTGFLFGGALLSKYHAVLLAVCLFGYLVASPDHRFWLKKLQPYAAVLIGLAVFVPNIIWNAQQGWISYAYQLGHGSRDGLDPGKFLAAVGGQLGAWSPVIFGLLAAVFIVLIRQKKIGNADRFAAWTSIPVFAFFCLAGLTTRILPHWTTAGWWTGALIVTAVVLRKTRSQNRRAASWRRWSLAAGAAGFLMTALIYLALFVPLTAPVYTWARDVSLQLNQRFPAIKPLAPFEPGFDPGNELFGWRSIARQLENIRAQMPHAETTFIFAHRFYTTSQLAVYLKPDTAATSLYRRFSQYRLWFTAENYTGWDALFIVERKRHRERAQRYLPLFERMDPQPETIEVFRNSRPAHILKVYRYYGFKGKYED